MTEEGNVSTQGKKINNKAIEEAKEAFNRVANTPDGRTVFRTIFNSICALNQSTLVYDPNTGQVMTDSMIYNDAQRTVALVIRSLIRRDILKVIDYGEDSTNATR